MPQPPKSAPVRWKIVRQKRADGTIKEYRYARPKVPERLDRDSVSELLRQFQASPEWHSLKPRTQLTYGIYLRHLKQIEGHSVTEIKRRNILTLRDAIAEGHGKGAATGFVRSVKAFFGWCRDRDWIESSPAHEVKTLPGGHLPTWSQAQADLAMRVLPEHLRRVVVLAMHTGQRRGDLISMTWAAYDGGTIRLTQEKTGAPLIVPCHSTLRSELDAWKREATSTHILTKQGKPWVPTTLSHDLVKEMTRAGLPHLPLHGLRKLAAVRLAEAGCSPHEIGAITGHKTLSMIELYTAQASQQRLAEAAIIRLERGGKSGKNSSKNR